MGVAKQNQAVDIKCVAVAGGTGQLGKYIIQGLREADPSLKIIVLSRKPLTDPSIDAEIEIIDYQDLNSMIDALTNVDIVVSALGTMAVGIEQKKLMEAAKAANVKRFYPSEFGLDTSNPQAQKTIDIIKPKVPFQDN